MDALFVFKNDVLQLTASLSAGALVSIDLQWIPNDDKELIVDISGLDDTGSHRWNPIPLSIGDSFSFVTRESTAVDIPIETLKPEELDQLQQVIKKNMKPEGKQIRPYRDTGKLYCQINEKEVFSFHLDKGDVSINFVWDGDRRGRSMMHVGSSGSSVPKIPRIRFGDLVRIWSDESPNNTPHYSSPTETR